MVGNSIENKGLTLEEFELELKSFEKISDKNKLAPGFSFGCIGGAINSQVFGIVPKAVSLIEFIATDFKKSAYCENNPEKSIGKADLFQEKLAQIWLANVLSVEERERENFVFHSQGVSNIVELEMSTTIGEASREIALELIKVLLNADRTYCVEALTNWSKSKKKATLGILSMILLGFRKSLEQGNTFVTGFYDRIFSNKFREYANNKTIFNHLERIRLDFRNPIAHGEKPWVDIQEYRNLVNYAFGTDSLKIWLETRQIYNNAVLDGFLNLPRSC